MTVLIDMDPAEGLKRAKSRNTSEERFEDFGEGLQRQMRQGFLDLSREYADRFVIIDGARSQDDVASDVLHSVTERLKDQAA